MQAQRDKKDWKDERGRRHENRIRRSNMWLIRVLEVGKRKDRVESIFKQILVMNFPAMTKDSKDLRSLS